MKTNKTARTTQYLIYRHGANAANQSLSERRPVAIVEAPSRAAATATVRFDCARLDAYAPSCLALAQHVDCWANQRFSAVPRSKASRADWNSVAEQEAE